MLKYLLHGINLVRCKLKDVSLVKRSGKWRTIEKHFIAINSVCSACGGNKNLEAHHIIPFHINKNLELDPNNLITLCMGINRDCHLLIGHGGSFRRINANSVADAAEISKDISKFAEVAARAEANSKL
jgi:5-methylcytosine-specific restriction enzyme A